MRPKFRTVVRIPKKDVVQALSLKHHRGFHEVFRKICAVIRRVTKIGCVELFDVHYVICRIDYVTSS
jgi:hypothetical protein